MNSETDLDIAYVYVKKFYGNQCAKRSKLPYMNHIDEGLTILDKLDAGNHTKAAWCLHPIVQADADIPYCGQYLRGLDPRVILLAVEYRHIANSYLSFNTIVVLDDIKLSPIEDVNTMLKADKVQNYKDFDRIFWGNNKLMDPLHQERLHTYFHNWLKRLKISTAEYEYLIEGLPT